MKGGEENMAKGRKRKMRGGLKEKEDGNGGEKMRHRYNNC